MVTITELWQPILLAAALAFIAGGLLHMVLPLHAKDFTKLPDEPGTLAQLKASGAAPGAYMLPCPSGPKDMNNPEFVAKLANGPVGIMFLRRPGPVAMGGSLALQGLFHLIVTIFVAYLAGRTLGPGVDYLRVFQVAGTTATLAYAAGGFPFAIWYRPPVRFVMANLLDGVIWGLLTAGAFGWLWPR